jgi:hypothetical protein
MNIIGIDLAGKPHNPTGICTLETESNSIFLKTIYSDEEILEEISIYAPDQTVIAIDAPLIKGNIPKIRLADKLLKKYGAMPPTMQSMKSLSVRATDLVRRLESKGYKVIEVFPTATAKILRVYNKDYIKVSKALNIEAKNKHELDAYLCALTGKLFLQGKTIEVGDEEGKIILPKNLY